MQVSVIRRATLFAAVAMLAWNATNDAVATFSVVAVDASTRRVGAGAATCSVGVENIRGIVPGRGALVAQAATNLSARDRGIELLAAGATAEQVLEGARTESENAWFGSSWNAQQFAVAVLEPTAATAVYTGGETDGWAGSVGGQGVSIQGNLLRAPRVAQAALEAFLSDEAAGAAGCAPSLAERIVRALEAGARAGGDRRCPEERGALTAFVQVSGPDAAADPVVYLVAPRAYGILGAIWHEISPVRPEADEAPPTALLRERLPASKRCAPDPR